MVWVRGLVALLVCSPLQQTPFPAAPGRQYSPLAAQADQAWRDFTYHYWDPANAIPRIRPSKFDGSIDNGAKYPTFWHVAEANNILFWRWKTTRSEPVREMIRSEFREILSRNRISPPRRGAAIGRTGLSTWWTMPLGRSLTSAKFTKRPAIRWRSGSRGL